MGEKIVISRDDLATERSPIDKKNEDSKERFEQGRQTVKEAIERLNLDVEDFPQEITDRLAVIVSEAPSQEKSHFNDAFQMTALADKLVESILNNPEDSLIKQIFSGYPLEKFKTATLIHDIGKSGPLGASRELQRDIVRLFPAQLGVLGDDFVRQLRQQEGFERYESSNVILSLSSLSIFLKSMELKDATGKAFTEIAGVTPERAREIFADELKLDLDRTQLLDGFWRLHVKWSYDILQDQVGKGFLDQDAADLVASHHLIEGKNPANVETDLEKFSTEDQKNDFFRKQFLIILDQYQAMRVRGKMDHRSIIDVLGRKVSGNENLSESFKSSFLTLLRELDENEAIVNQIFVDAT